MWVHKNTLRDAGFSLLEVLIATAIVGIAMGVLMSGLAQSHGQAYRGKLTMDAATVAQDLIRRFQEKGFPSSEEGTVDGRAGWRYLAEVRDLSVKIRTQGEEEKELEVPELREFVLTIQPPDNAVPFMLTVWIRPQEVLQ